MALRELDLPALRDPIATALEAYQEQADGRLTFDVAHASKLEKVAGKLTYARNTSDGTPVQFADGSEATLWTIAFMPGDGTGDRSNPDLAEAWVEPGVLPRDHWTPRSKAAMLAEVCMSVCALDLDRPQRGPKLFAAGFLLIGLIEKPSHVDGELAVGQIGQFGADVMAVSDKTELVPQSAVTVGPVNKDRQLDMSGDREGDPHAVTTLPGAIVNIGAFLGIPQDSTPEAFAALQSLNPTARFR